MYKHHFDVDPAVWEIKNEQKAFKSEQTLMGKNDRRNLI